MKILMMLFLLVSCTNVNSISKEEAIKLAKSEIKQEQNRRRVCTFVYLAVKRKHENVLNASFNDCTIIVGNDIHEFLDDELNGIDEFFTLIKQDIK